MANSVWQKIYDKIHAWRPQAWLKLLLQEINDALISILIGVGQDFIQKASYKIISLAKSDISNSDKVEQFKKWALLEIPNAKDSTINLIREMLVVKFKMQGLF